MIDIEEIVLYPDRLRMDADPSTYYDQEFGRRLHQFLEVYEKIRRDETASHQNIEDYPLLPFGNHSEYAFEWMVRRASLRAVLNTLQGKYGQDILEIGPWNGWLSNRLAGMGHHLLAVDYFADDVDGLRARHRYPNTWLTMQTNIAALDFHEESFDVVILNHSLQFSADPVTYVEGLKRLVRRNGLLILPGLSFHSDPSAKQQSVEQLRQRYRKHHDFDIFFAPTKGYLDGSDRRALKSIGVRLFPYREPMLLARNLLATVVRTRPSYGYGVWVNE